MAIAKLQVGDLLRVRPGEKIAVDGVIIEGAGAIDESMMTGSSTVDQSRGDKVFGGSVTQTGSIVMRAEK